MDFSKLNTSSSFQKRRKANICLKAIFTAYGYDLVMGEPDGVVAVPDVEVEGDAPHDDQPHVDLQQLPADCAASAPEGICVLHHHHLPEALFSFRF